MDTLDIILKEIKEVPVEKLEEVYVFIHNLTQKYEASKHKKAAILNLSGAFDFEDERDFEEFLQVTKDARNNMFT